MATRTRTKCPKCDKMLTPQGMNGHLRSHSTRKKASVNGEKRLNWNKGLNEYLKAISNGETFASAAVVQSRISKLNEQITAAQEAGLHLKAVRLTQKRIALEHAGGTSDLEEIFVDEAASYSDFHDISYETWREIGVPARVLKKAGISR